MAEIPKNRRYSAHRKLKERQNAAAIRALGRRSSGRPSEPVFNGNLPPYASLPPGRDLARRSLEIHPADDFGRDA